MRAVQLAREGEVPEAFRDLDCDGKTSVLEWLRGGIDFRMRPSQLVPGCQDVYAGKTGRGLVVGGEAAPQGRLARDIGGAGQRGSCGGGFRGPPPRPPT